MRKVGKHTSEPDEKDVKRLKASIEDADRLPR